MNATHNNNNSPQCHQRDASSNNITNITCDLQGCNMPILPVQTRTFDFKFESYDGKEELYPGIYVVDDNCHEDCLIVRDNVNKIADFIQNYLGEPFILVKDSQNNVQEPYIASINVVEDTNDGNRVWENSAWHLTKKQVLFGQRYINNHINNQLISYGTDITVVAHEFCHGIIQKINLTNTKDEIKNIQRMSNHNHCLNESKAIEESFCDIFAILTRNYYDNNVTWNDLNTWKWDVGENFIQEGISSRCLDTMRSLDTEITREIADDNHKLSLFHSHAFYLLINKKDDTPENNYFFDSQFALKLFAATVAYTTSGFSASRKAFETSATKLLESDPLRDTKLQAISEAFIAVEKKYNLTQLN